MLSGSPCSLGEVRGPIQFSLCWLPFLTAKYLLNLFLFLQFLPPVPQALLSHLEHSCSLIPAPSCLSCLPLNLRFTPGLLLWAECSCPSQFICGNPKPQCVGIRRWGFGEVTDREGGALPSGISALIRETLQSSPARFLRVMMRILKVSLLFFLFISDNQNPLRVSQVKKHWLIKLGITVWAKTWCFTECHLICPAIIQHKCKGRAECPFLQVLRELSADWATVPVAGSRWAESY